jgi:hypothetical protein
MKPTKALAVRYLWTSPRVMPFGWACAGLLAILLVVWLTPPSVGWKLFFGLCTGLAGQMGGRLCVWLSRRLDAAVISVLRIVQVIVLKSLQSKPLLFISSTFQLQRYPHMSVELEEAILRARDTRKGLSLNFEILRLRFDVFITVMILETQSLLRKFFT